MKLAFIIPFLIMFISACASHPQKNHTESSSTDVKIQLPEQMNAANSPQAKDVEKTDPSNPLTQEWKAECRKNVNETGQEVKYRYKRLQSSYIFNGNDVVWFVKTYTDTQCNNFYNGYKYTFKCDSDPTKTTAKCAQNSISEWKNNKWNPQKMVDHAGFKNELIMEYKLNTNQKDNRKAVLNSRSVSDDGELERQNLSL